MNPKESSVLPLLSLISLALVCVSISGCGYALAGRGSFLPSTIRTIGIPTFVNRTRVFNLETQLTQKVRSEFIGRGRYNIVPDSTGVDALLTGEVTAVTVAPVAFTGQQLASRYTITMTARVELRELSDNKVLWENPGLVFRQDYETQTGNGTNTLDPVAFFGQDANALDRLSADFARTIVSSILEAF
jgi:hypothetical protein